MKKSIFFILFMIFLYSCNRNKNGITVEIKNSSNNIIHDVTFYSDGKTKLFFDKINSGQSVKKFHDMTDNFKGDGNYSLLFKSENGETKLTSGGYYTNGSSLDQKVIYEIKNDTVLMSFKDFFGL